MDGIRRSRIVFGIVLIVLGAWFLAVQLVPGLSDIVNVRFGWPLILVGLGLVFMIAAVAGGTPGLAVPACVVGGIGALLYWQNATGNWESWAYAWTLIPGFVGVGTILMGLLGRGNRGALAGGVWLVVISLVLFAVLGSFLGGLDLLGPYWPVLLIALGVVLLMRSLWRQGRGW